MTTTYSTCGPPTDNPAATSWVCWPVTETLAHATPAQTLDDGDRIPAQQTGGTDQAISGVQPHTATHNGGAQKTATSIPHFTLSPAESDPPDQAAATSPPSTAASQSSGGSNGVSKGAVAGIAIATAILGAALAFLAAFLLFKRRARPKGSSPYNSTPNLLAYSKSSQSPYISISQTPTATPLPPPSSPPPQSSNDLLASFLPPPADHQTIRSRVAALFAEVQRHVDTFYRDVHASITPTMEADLRRFSTGGEGGVVEMLQGASVPTEVLKRVLGVYILRVVAPEGEGEGEGGTLFPADVVGVKGVGVGSGEREDLAKAHALYKRLAVFLHTASDKTPALASELREAAEHFALAFFPWADPGCGDRERDEDLVGIIGEALEVSVWLYGQPFVYEFFWEGGRGVAPGLGKVVEGRRIVVMQGN